MIKQINISKDYINIARAQSLKDPKERILYRLLEILPGFLIWTTIILAILLSWLTPGAVAIFIILFSLYWLLRVCYLSFHQIVSFRRMKRNLKINWQEKLNKINNWRDIYHLIILPSYKEEREIIESSLYALVNSKYPKDRFMVILAIEERAGEKFKREAEEIKKKFSKEFFQLLISIHPHNLPGEIAGKGSNVAWALKTAKEKLIQPLGIPFQNIIVSDFDIDTRPYQQYFSCLTFHYLKNQKSKKLSFQPIPVYNNNIWSAPAFSRVIATSNTFWQMMQQERPELLISYSSHSIPFETIDKVGYPKNVVADDSRIFWKSYFFYDGDYKIFPLHYPVSMDAVMAKSLSRTIINQYKQQRRWAWGCIEIPFVIFGFLKNKKISLLQKIYHSLNSLEGYWSWATSALLIFFLGWLPLTLGGEKFNFSLLSYNLPRLTRNIMAIAMVGMLVSCIISLLILPPRPREKSRLKNLSMILQWGLLPLTLIVFGCFPAIDAQTRLMIKKYLGFWPTEKKR